MKIEYIQKEQIYKYKQSAYHAQNGNTVLFLRNVPIPYLLF